jgi:Secretion system C-terminal sorting domain/Divergent InlB B-repeat domain
MISKSIIFCQTAFLTSRKFGCLGFLTVLSIFLSWKGSAQSMQQFATGTDKELVVYSDVPGLTASPYYSIKVKSEATGGNWIDVFTNWTKNKADQIPADGLNKPVTNWAYQNHTKAWTHTYGNIEMTDKEPVEVEISLKGQAIKGSTVIVKAGIHPFQKAFNAKVENGKAYFTLYNPCQIVIDINGQMDDVNKAVNGTANDIVHAVSLFANPIMNDKPASSGASGVVYVQPGQTPPVIGNNTTMYFLPGVHNVDFSFKVLPNKSYYIPGDAIVYGTFNNVNISFTPSGSTIAKGQGIKIFGYGTISGSKLVHHTFNPSTSNELYKGVNIEDSYLTELKGITVDDTANHAVALDNYGPRPNKAVPVSFASWVKVITWRANGDGIVADDIQDCFLRTSDDCSYMKGNRRRLTFWKDSNAAIFHMASIPVANTTPPRSFPILIEDCDVIYNRARDRQGEGITGVFHLRGTGETAGLAGSRTINVTVKNIRIHDKRSNMPTFNMYTTLSPTAFIQPYIGLTFENIWVADNINPSTYRTYARLDALPAAPWGSGLVFKNIYDRSRIYSSVSDFTVTSNAQPLFSTVNKLSIIVSSGPNGQVTTPSTIAPAAGAVFNTEHTVVAVPDAGHEFLYWTEGDIVVSLTPSYSFNVNKDRNLKANFKSSLSTRSNESQNGIVLYPNPVKHTLNLNFSNSTNREVQVFNILGQKVYAATTQKNHLEIDVKSLHLNGIVLIKVISEEGISTQKIVVE